MSTPPIETERKFLILMPELSALESFSGVRIKKIAQTYLLSEEGKGARVREICENGKTSYIKTLKSRISTLSCYEEEWELSYEEYAEALTHADRERVTIYKTRYCLPLEDRHIAEIDIYPFWSDRAILEVELGDENESFCLPDFISIIREVSADKRYKNTSLALAVPFDEI